MDSALLKNKRSALSFLTTLFTALLILTIGFLFFEVNNANAGTPGQRCTYQPGGFTGGPNRCENNCVVNNYYVYDSAGVCSYPPGGEVHQHFCCPSGQTCSVTNNVGSCVPADPPTDCPDNPTSGGTNACVTGSSCPNGTTYYGSATNNECGAGKVCCNTPPAPPSACPDDAGGGATNICHTGSSCPPGMTQNGGTNNACGAGQLCCTRPPIPTNTPTNTPIPTATRTPDQPTNTPGQPQMCNGLSCDQAAQACKPFSVPAGPAGCGILTCDEAACNPGQPTPTQSQATPTPQICNKDCASDAECPLGGGNTCTYCNPTTDKCEVPPGQPTPTATPVPACNTPCNNPATCQGAQDGCTYCNPSTDKCEKPASTPTPGPACNSSCENNPNICQQASGGCTYCNPTTDKCERPECGTPCNIPADCNGALTCNACLPDPNSPTGKSCQQTPACNSDCSQNPAICQQSGDSCKVCDPNTKKCVAPPTATPTPPFDESMCKCDGIEHTTLALGLTSDITAYGKVLGVNKQYAKIPSIRFKFMSGNDPTHQTEIETATINTTVVLDTAEQRRYKAVWPLTLDAGLDTTQTYRIQAKVNCARNVAFYSPAQQNTAVLAETTGNKGFIASIFDFFANLFGGGSKPPASQNVTGPQTATGPTSAAKKNLQLQTFRPATNIEYPKDADNCTFIKFNFEE